MKDLPIQIVPRVACRSGWNSCRQMESTWHFEVYSREAFRHLDALRMWPCLSLLLRESFADLRLTGQHPWA